MRKQKKNAIKRTMKRVAAFMASAVAIVICVSLVISSIWNDAIDAQAEDTLLGIEKLRLQVANSGREYTILEVVPNKNTAEIGFLVDGCELILGEWDEEGNWINWKEKLVSIEKYEDRVEYIDGLKKKLSKYYEKTGNKWGKDYPVYGESGKYIEAEKPTEGFEKITAAKVTKTGYFKYAEGENAGPYYRIAFKYHGGNITADSKTLYYTVSGEPMDIIEKILGKEKIEDGIDEEEFEELKNGLNKLPDDLYVYTRSSGSYKEFEPHPWSQEKDRYMEKLQEAYESALKAKEMSLIEEEEAGEEEEGEEGEGNENDGENGEGEGNENGGENGEGEGNENGGENGEGEGNENGGENGEGEGNENGGENGEGEGNENGGENEEGEGNENGGENEEGEGNENGGENEEGEGNENGGENGEGGSEGTDNGDESGGGNGTNDANGTGGSNGSDNGNDGYEARAIRKSLSQGRWIKLVGVNERTTLSLDNDLDAEPSGSDDKKDEEPSDSDDKKDEEPSGSDDKKDEEISGSDDKKDEEPSDPDDKENGESSDPDDKEDKEPSDSDDKIDGESPDSDKETDSGKGPVKKSPTVSGNSNKIKEANEYIELVEYPEYYIVEFVRITADNTKDVPTYYVNDPNNIKESSTKDYAYSFVDLSDKTINSRNKKNTKKLHVDEDADDTPKTDDEDVNDTPKTDDEDVNDTPKADDEDVNDTPKTDDEDVNDTPDTDDDEDANDTPKTDGGEDVNDSPKTDDGEDVNDTPKTDDGEDVSDTLKTDNDDVIDASKTDNSKFVKYIAALGDDLDDTDDTGKDSGDTAYTGDDSDSTDDTGKDSGNSSATGDDSVNTDDTGKDSGSTSDSGDESGNTTDTDEDDESGDTTDTDEDDESGDTADADNSDSEAKEESNYKNETYAGVEVNTANNPDVQEYTFLGKTIYCKNTFKSNNWFKRYVLNMEESEFDQFSIKVITLTPEEINEMGTLPEFDFLYLNSGLRSISDDDGTDDDGEGEGSGGNGEGEEEGGSGNGEGEGGSGNGEGEGEGGNSDGGEGDEGSNDEFKAYEKDNDLSDRTLQYLVSRTVAGALPCLVDGAILYTYAEEGSEDSEAKAIKINENLKSTNIFKLSAIMCQDSLSEWYERNSGNLKGVSVNDLINGIVEDADKNFVTEQVYCRFDDISIINKDFHTATIYRDGWEMDQGFQKVLDEILLDNTYREADSSGNYRALSTDIGQATAVRHIISYQNRRRVEPKEKIKVLEIQPAKVDKPELTLEQLQAWAPGVKEAEITVMTTAEFIGKIEKLNETYDLIYIGTSDDHLNVKYWDGQTPNSNTLGSPSSSGKVSAGTVFNDSNMDGLIYYNIGDLRAGNVPLAGQLDTEYVNPSDRSGDVFAYNYYRYGGNDITKEKKEALISFLNGSYPIIISDDFIEQPVTVFGDDYYKGPRVSLSVGYYTRNDLNKLGGVLAQDVSSIKVKEGYKITIFDGDEFTGHAITLDKNTDNLRSIWRYWNWYDDWGDWNNYVRSAIVERVDDKSPVKRIDEDHIDNCTYLYDFVKTAMEKDYINFYTWSEIEDDSELFKFYLNRPKVSIQQTFVNGERKNSSGSEIYYISPGNDGRYRLEFHFVIHNEGAASANSRYLCRLYIDINSDGKFSEEEEVPDISLTQGGGGVAADGLYIDREYVLTRGVPDGYKGLLPWKVEVTQADNDNIYASMSGYTKLEGMEKEKIDVIQISRTPWNVSGADVLNLEKEIADENSIFHKLIDGGVIDGVEYKGITDDYEINVDCMTVAEFETLYYENPDCMKNYNMLILGFSDMYDDFSGTSEEGPMSAIVDFINSGKSVLFAHDTTSYVNYAQGVSGHADKTNPSSTTGAVSTRSHFAANMNKYVRGLVGMDRYGILSDYGNILRQGQALQEGSDSYNQIVSSGKDVAYEPKSNKERTVPQVHGYTYHIINLKDGTTDNNKKSEFTPAELDPNLTGNYYNTFRNIRYDQVYYVWSYNDYGEGKQSGAVSYMNVTQVNKGQITEYPYHLPEKFEVATTHGQYYELDFTADDDGDGQSDLVVWYCLGNRNVDNADQETIYSQSPNDVRNNYYIYNKGNVTYTGMGHGASHDDKPYTLDEAKLFINTIIAAYQAGVKQPYITVLKSGLSESAELKMMYRYYDASYTGTSESLDYLATPEVYEKIYFRVQDLNFVKGSRAIAAHVFYGADDGTETITVEGNQVTVNRLADYIFNAADGSPADANNLKSNGIYYIMVPKAVLEQCDEGLDLYFEAQTTITPNTVNQKVYVTDKVYAKLKVLKAFLFDLE